MTLSLAVCFSLFFLVSLWLHKIRPRIITFTKGELVISNKEPPPGSKIIKQLPGVTDREVP